MYRVQELLDGYRSKKFSPVEITKEYIKRAKLNKSLNAFISITEDTALKQAEMSELKWQHDEPGRLEGIPLSYKDNFHTKGIASTSGSKIDAQFIPNKNAPIIDTMNRAGATMIGKNNMHEFAFGITNNNPFYGPAKNPWDMTLIPGGSSGGSAVAVAADLSVASLGTDTGGSVRIPAACCGLVGLKPTKGSLVETGLTPISWSLDHPGPITRNVDDLIAIMEGLTGKDYAVIDPGAKNLRGVKVGVPRKFFTEKIELDVLASFEETIAKLEELGAHVIDVEIPYPEEVSTLNSTLAIAEAGYEHRDRMTKMNDYGYDVAHVMKASKSILSAEYIHALKRRDEITRLCDRLLEQVDIILTPTIPAQPKPIGQELVIFGDEQEPIFDCMIRYTSYFNLTGHPAISLPVGLKNDMPVAVQLVSGKWKERRLISISKIFEDHYLEQFYTTRQNSVTAPL